MSFGPCEAPHYKLTPCRVSGISNAPVHNSVVVTDYLTKMGIKTFPQPPYITDLAPCNVCLFPKLTGFRYETIEMKETSFVWTLLLIVHTWNSSPFRSNLLRLQCTCCTVPTTSGRLHGSPLLWARQWPSSQPLSSPQLSHNDSLWV